MADMDELIRAALEAPALPLTPVAELRARAMTRRWRRFGLAAAGAIVTASTFVAVSMALPSSGPGRAERVITTDPPTTTTTSSWPEQTVALSKTPMTVVAGAGYVLAVPAQDGPGVTPVTIDSYDIRTGGTDQQTFVSEPSDGSRGPQPANQQGPGPSPAFVSVAFGTTFWITYNTCSLSGCWTNITSDSFGSNLSSFSDTLDTSGPTTVAASSGSPVWVGATTGLYRIDPAHRQVTAFPDPAETAWSVSVDPTGRYVYAGTVNSDGKATVEERDAGTGRLLATNQAVPAAGGLTLSAASDGVWVSYSTGMQNQVMKLLSFGLVALDPAGGYQYGSKPVDIWGQPYGGAIATVSGGVLWLTAARGGEGLACADPLTGRVLAIDSNPAGAKVQSSVTFFEGKLYAATPRGLAVSTPPPACTA
jgi:hypothetical protein